MGAALAPIRPKRGRTASEEDRRRPLFERAAREFGRRRADGEVVRPLDAVVIARGGISACLSRLPLIRAKHESEVMAVAEVTASLSVAYAQRRAFRPKCAPQEAYQPSFCSFRPTA